MKLVHVLQIIAIVLSLTGICLFVWQIANISAACVAGGGMVFGISEKVHKEVIKKSNKK